MSFSSLYSLATFHSRSYSRGTASVSLSLSKIQLRPASSLGFLALPLVLMICVSRAHNITDLLAKHSEFSTFNHYLTETHLAPEINQRTTITVCVVDNDAMADLLAKHLSIYSIKNALSLHALLDYFGAKKLHQITNDTVLAATMFQATGTSPAATGFVNITDLLGGKVDLSPEENDGESNSYFVKSVEEIPYNISVIQISNILQSEVAEAPTPGPSEFNLMGIMSSHGCKLFADTLLASGAEKTFEENAIGGLTVFCPIDEVFKAFLPKYKNLTAAGKKSEMEYHAVPIYMSIPMLKSTNDSNDFAELEANPRKIVVASGSKNCRHRGPLSSHDTLATDGANKFDFTMQNDGEEVTLKTNIVTLKITSALLDKQPVVIYTIDKVLKPKELFKGEVSASAPAPNKKVKPHKTGKGNKEALSPGSDIAADSLQGKPADMKAGSDNHSFRLVGLRARLGAACLCAGLLLL